MSLQQYIYILPGHIYSLASLDDGIYCQIRAYIQWVSMPTVYYSNALQAIHRCCQIVFYTKKSLQTFQLYIFMIVIQWIICFLIVLSSLFLGDFKYNIDDYFCQIQYSNLRGLLVNSTTNYLIPMYITVGCYVFTMRKLRKGNNHLILTMPYIQQTIARRNSVVLFRICLLVGILLITSIPSLISLLIYIFTGYVPWWSVQIQYTISILAIIGVYN